MTTKVLFLIDQLRRGGAERLLLDLLPRLPAYGIEPHFCVLGREVPMLPNFRSAGIEPIVLGGGKWDPCIVDRLAKLIDHNEIDLVNAHLGKSVVVGWLAARRAGVPLIAHDHVGNMWPQLGGNFTHRLENRLMWFATDWCLCRAAAVVAVSGNCRDWLVRRHPRLEQTVTTISNGIDLRSLGEVRAARERWRWEVRREFAFPEASPIVLYAASFRPIKGWDTFIDIAERICASHPDVHFLGGGEGPMRSELLARVAASGLGDRIHLPGVRPDVPRLMAAADIFLMPTNMESDGIVAKEAMAMGLPVVASDLPILSEKIEHGTSGFLVPAGDAAGFVTICERLLADPALRVASGNAALAHASRFFDIATCVEKTQSLFHRVAAGQATRGKMGRIAGWP